jgi:hypothetical protein
MKKLGSHVMERKRLFEPGDTVMTFGGEIGIVISKEMLEKVASRFKQGRRPGHFFSPGCCYNPDYITQIPVFFEDGTFDVMRSMNLKRKGDLSEEKRLEFERKMRSYEGRHV